MELNEEFYGTSERHRLTVSPKGSRRQPSEPPSGLGRAELYRPFVPGTRLNRVGPDAEHAEFLQHQRIEGGTERERGLGIGSAGGASQHQPGRGKVASPHI